MNAEVEKIRKKYAGTHTVSVKELNYILEYLRALEAQNAELERKLAEKAAQEREQ